MKESLMIIDNRGVRGMTVDIIELIFKCFRVGCNDNKFESVIKDKPYASHSHNTTRGVGVICVTLTSDTRRSSLVLRSPLTCHSSSNLLPDCHLSSLAHYPSLPSQLQSTMSH